MGSDWKKISWQMTTERVGASAGCFLLLERITKAGHINHKYKTRMKEEGEIKRMGENKLNLTEKQKNI